MEAELSVKSTKVSIYQTSFVTFHYDNLGSNVKTGDDVAIKLVSSNLNLNVQRFLTLICNFIGASKNQVSSIALRNKNIQNTERRR